MLVGVWVRWLGCYLIVIHVGRGGFNRSHQQEGEGAGEGCLRHVARGGSNRSDQIRRGEMADQIRAGRRRGAQGVGRGSGRGGGRLTLHAVLCAEAVRRLKPLLTQLADLDALSDVTMTSLFPFSFNG